MDHARILRQFRDIVMTIDNDHVRRWKQRGKPVMGYFCSYTPLELLTAGGILPFRFRAPGNRDSGSGDVFMSSRTCTFVRHVMALALEGKFDFLDGEISLNTCDHVRRSFDVWRHKTKTGFHGFLSVPRNVRETLYPWYREEVVRLKQQVEEHFAIRIDDEDLRRAITVHNRLRSLLARCDALRAEMNPQLLGSELLSLTVAAMSMPPEISIEKLNALIDALDGDQRTLPDARARVILLGAELDEPDFIRVIEKQGAHVAGDALCFGMRSHQALIDEDTPDPLDAICRRYFFQVPCARMMGNFPQRVDAILSTMKERQIEGVIFQRIKFCDPWGGESHNLRHRFKDPDIPFLVLEREYGSTHAGQVSTRVQAFLEMLESKRRRSASGARRVTQNGDGGAP